MNRAIGRCRVDAVQQQIGQRLIVVLKPTSPVSNAAIQLPPIMWNMAPLRSAKVHIIKVIWEYDAEFLIAGVPYHIPNNIDTNAAVNIARVAAVNQPIVSLLSHRIERADTSRAVSTAAVS